MYSTLIFDLDGTLLNTLGDLAAAGNHTLATLGCPTHKEEDYRLMVGNGIRVLISRMLPSDKQDPASLKEAYRLFSAYYSQHGTEQTKPYPGILDMLHVLKHKGHQLAVLSNKNHDYVQHLVPHYFGTLFDCVIGLRAPFAPKPNPGSLQALMHELHAVPSSCLFCGDSAVDIQTAKEASIASCAVLWGFRTHEELKTECPTHFVQTAQEIITLGHSTPIL